MADVIAVSEWDEHLTPTATFVDITFFAFLLFIFRRRPSVYDTAAVRYSPWLSLD